MGSVGLLTTIPLDNVVLLNEDLQSPIGVRLTFLSRFLSQSQGDPGPFLVAGEPGIGHQSRPLQ